MSPHEVTARFYALLAANFTSTQIKVYQRMASTHMGPFNKAHIRLSDHKG